MELEAGSMRFPCAGADRRRVSETGPSQQLSQARGRPVVSRPVTSQGTRLKAIDAQSTALREIAHSEPFRLSSRPMGQAGDSAFNIALDRAASIHDRNEVCLTLRATAAALELCSLLDRKRHMVDIAVHLR
jgi:hypothetical protein